MSAPTTSAPARPFDRLTSKYRKDHQHPVNHVLHVYVGWPLCALGVILFPLNPWFTLYGFALGYAFMWFGHFVFERNLPTVFKHPTTPFVMAGAVISGIVRGTWRLVAGDRAR